MAKLTFAPSYEIDYSSACCAALRRGLFARPICGAADLTCLTPTAFDSGVLQRPDPDFSFFI